tara:strand:- start:893 stop:1312 length:420 start_codon:yes stop_codon:yes gene_type:complete
MELDSMKKLLWLDDVRNPFVMSDWLLQWSPEYHYEKDEGTHEVIWVKDYDEFVGWIQENGLPTEIGFDHDLADVVYSKRGNIDMLKSTWKEKTGMDCAKWLVDYCIEHKKGIPKFFVQSANPVGKKNITTFLNNAIKHI